jgi:ankyrin repeat protein
MNMATSNPAEWKLIKELVNLCKSDSLSFERLQESTNFIPRRTAKAGLIFGSTNLIHLVFTHPKVTKEMVELLLDLNPDVAGFYYNIYRPSSIERFRRLRNNEIVTDEVAGRVWSLPLHDACKNENFSASAIQTLVKLYPTALVHRARYMDRGDRFELPLQIYLSRKSNIEIDAIKVLVDTVPEDIVTECVHTFVSYEKIGQYRDVVKFLIVQQQLPIHKDLPLLHAALLNKSGCPSDIILFLAEKFPFALTHQYTETSATYDDEGNSTSLGFDDATPLGIYLAKWHHIDYTVAESLLAPLTNPMIKDSLLAFFLCGNVGSHLDIVKMLIERNPSAVEATTENGASLLHLGCRNKSMTLQIAKFLVEKRKGLIHQPDSQSRLPLHALFTNSKIDESTSIEIFKFLVGKHPESIRHRVEPHGSLAVHYAAAYGPRCFCEALINEYPESLLLADEMGYAPIHVACEFGKKETAEYFYSLAPTSIEIANNDGKYPIHLAATNLNSSEVIEFLLEQHPQEAARLVNGELPFHLAVASELLIDPRADRRQRQLKIVEHLFDAHPAAILERNRAGKLPLNIVRNASYHHYGQEIREFIREHTDIANKAKDLDTMTTVDEEGCLLLHQAMLHRYRLGAVKLIVNGNPSAVQTTTLDNCGSLPLHLACQYGSVAVVDYLVELDGRSLGQSDRNADTPLHYACFGGNLSVINVLLKKQPQPVSQLNADEKLPIHLLWECEDIDNESAEYMETVWRLLRAYPETLTLGELLNENTLHGGTMPSYFLQEL